MALLCARNPHPYMTQLGTCAPLPRPPPQVATPTSNCTFLTFHRSDLLSLVVHTHPLTHT